MLAQLTQAAKNQLTQRAASIAGASPKEAEQLALDLIAYRWASCSSSLSVDVKGIDGIIPALARTLDDETIDWAAEMFSTSTKARQAAALPSRDDERVAQLSDLHREYRIAVEYRESSPIEAVNALTAALDICRKLHLDLSEALLLKELGDHYLYHMSRYREAEVSYNRAIWIYSAYDCIRSTAIIYDDYGTLAVRTGRFSAAVENYTLAARQWVLLSGQDPGGYKYRDLAGREYMMAGDAQMAAGDTEKALELMTRYGLDQLRTWAHVTKSYKNLITNLIRVARLYRESKNTTKALDLLQEAKRACRVQGDPLLTAKTYEEFTQTYTVANQSVNASEAKRKAEGVLREAAAAGEAALVRLDKPASVSTKTRTALLTTAERGALAYQELKSYPKSTVVWQRLAALYRNVGLVDNRIRALVSLARVFDLRGKPRESLEARREAVLVAMKSNKKALAAEIGREMVQGFIDTGDLRNALEGFTEIAPIFEAAGDVRGAASIQEARGSLLATNGQYDEAIRDFQDARVRYLSQVGDQWAAAEVSLKLADAQKALDRLTDARAALETGLGEIEAIYAVENLDPAASPERSRLVMKLYRALATVHVRQGSKEEAEKTLRKAKRYLWLPELITQMRTDTDRVIADFAASLDIIGGVTQPISQPSAPGSGRVLADNWPAFAETCWMLQKQYPAAFNSLPICPLDLFRFRNSLPKDGVVVEYMFAESSVYAFVCGFDKPICRELGLKREDIDSLVSDLRRSLKNCEESLGSGMPIPPVGDWQSSAFMEIKKPLVGLYSRLIEPIEQQLEQRRLVMFALPDELAGLPMHALITDGNQQTPKFFVQDHEIGYLARGMLDNLVGRDNRSIDQSSDRLAIFADPENNLAGAVEEAKTIRNCYFNSMWYLGAKATVANFKAECERASVLHIAAHYRIDPNPSKFEILLAPDSGSDGSIGIQELSQITNTHLGLVVLSACNSIASADPISTGPSRAAEMFSMTGAKSVLGGLWKVSDAAAAKVIGDFYRSISRGKSRTEALRRAQIEVLESKQFAHPFYWACFALYGNPR